MKTAIQEAVFEQGRSLAIRGAGHVAERMLGNFISDTPAASVAATQTFSVGATSFIAITAAGLGALAGYALCEMKKSSRR